MGSEMCIRDSPYTISQALHARADASTDEDCPSPAGANDEDDSRPTDGRGRGRRRGPRAYASIDRTLFERRVRIGHQDIEIPVGAKNDYVICVDIDSERDIDSEQDIVWEGDFQEWEVEGVKDASHEWLVAIGLAEAEDED